MEIKFSVWLLLILALAGCKNLDDSKISSASCLKTMPAPISLQASTSLIGSDEAYPEERPQRREQVGAFEIDTTEVTNEQFDRFVEDTGYVTDAEKPQPGFDVPGGAVFSPPTDSNASWWHFTEGASWRHPEGPESTIKGRAFDPVVQVTLNDARAYASWAKRRLPTEIEWEYAAKAGSETLYVWGDERTPNDKEKANTWQGAFPIQNSAADGFETRAPVGCYDPNAFGLYDMIGNVWEWTDTEWSTDAAHVIKGGSFLCAENFCRRYRGSARQPQESNFSTNHIGFRTVK